MLALNYILGHLTFKQGYITNGQIGGIVKKQDKNENHNKTKNEQQLFSQKDLKVVTGRTTSL